MTPEQFTAMLGALGALVVAVTGLIVQVRAWRKEIDGHMDKLLQVSTMAAMKAGELQGRDWEREQTSSEKRP